MRRYKRIISVSITNKNPSNQCSGFCAAKCWFVHLPSPMIDKHKPTDDAKYNLRLPTHFTMHTHVNVPQMPVTPRKTVARFGLIGMPYDLRICTIYGRMANTPENCEIINAIESRTNGLRFRLRSNSCNFCVVVGDGCVHFTLAFVHFVHALDISL